MTKQEIKERSQQLLLEEAKKGESNWYYISMADENSFKGGFLIKAPGPLHAMRFLHLYGFWEDGCNTQATGPLDEEQMKEVPQGWCTRKLSRAEVEQL